MFQFYLHIIKSSVLGHCHVTVVIAITHSITLAVDFTILSEIFTEHRILVVFHRKVIFFVNFYFLFQHFTKGHLKPHSLETVRNMIQQVKFSSRLLE